MISPIILLLLRLLSASLLLAFLFGMAWLIYQDMKATTAVLATQARQRGSLRVVANGSGSQAVDTVYPLLPITSIGRVMGSTVVLDNNYVSGQHALIIRRDGQWWLEDLGSRNGTELNDVAITEATVISTGDVITIGDTRLKVEVS